MSVTSPLPDPVSGIAFTAVGQVCLYCGKSLADPAIHWSGFGAEIYLHDPCVDELVIRLNRDRHELRAPDFYRRIREGPGR